MENEDELTCAPGQILTESQAETTPAATIVASSQLTVINSSEPEQVEPDTEQTIPKPESQVY